jgi:MFS transporter, ACS family, hexuronate transporter
MFNEEDLLKKKYRWNIVAMLSVAGAINYLDRAAFGIALPFIKEKFELSPEQLGLLGSAFFIGYALFNFVGGYLSDVYGPKKVMALAMLVWSLFCGLTATTVGFISLFFVRVFFGMGEGPIASTVNKMVSNWMPAGERARAIGFASAGNPLGGAIAGPVVGFIALTWGWQVSFIVLTFIGVIWWLVWHVIATDHPHQNPRVSKEEVLLITASQPQVRSSTSKEKVSFFYFVKKPTILFTALAFFSLNYILYFFITWFPSYLVNAKNMSIQGMSILTVAPWLLGAIGLACSGIASDFIYKKTGDLMFSRKSIIVLGLTISAGAVVLSGLVESIGGIVALMAVTMFSLYITAALYWAIVTDNVAQEKVGAVGGFMHLLANLSGIIAPWLTGHIIQNTGAYTGAFVVAGCLAVIGALSVAFFVKPIRA